MKLYVKITGEKPFVLELNDGLKTEHYKEIVQQYCREKEMDGELFLTRLVHFEGKDKLIEFRKKEAFAKKFDLDLQLQTPIYEEPEACEESIKLGAKEFLVSLNRLILKITDPYADPTLMKAFFWLYRNFLKPQDFLLKLIERFFIPDLDVNVNYSFLEFNFYTIHLQRAVRQKIVKILFDWVCDYSFDFAEEKLRSTLLEFCKGPLYQYEFKAAANEIIDRIPKPDPQTGTVSQLHKWLDTGKTFEEQMNILFPRLASTDPSQILVKGFKDKAKEFSEQLTIVTHRLYCQLHFSELQQYSKGKKQLAPNFSFAVMFHNKISNIVQYMMLRDEEDKRRKKTCKFFVKCMDHLADMNSFDVLFAVHGGLTHYNVLRLNESADWYSKYKDKIEYYSQLVSYQANYAKLRALMDNAYSQGKPCTVYLGITSKDLLFFQDGNEWKIDGKINFYKSIGMYHVMWQALRFQNRAYNIAENLGIIKEVVSFKTVDEEALQEMYKVLKEKYLL